MQLYRITNHYGSSLQQISDDTDTLYPLNSREDAVYAMGDGSMILTREQGGCWKEVKLGRIFRAADCRHPEGKSGSIAASQYISHFGDSRSFTQKMDKVLEGYGNIGRRLIFITDGALWLRNWIENAYPDAVSILDYYHAQEYLCSFARDYFSNDELRNKWITEQQELLLESRTEQVIDNVKMLYKNRKLPSASKLILYYEDNIDRMDYKHYKTIGKGLIGSGAMESSHKTVIQVRMKRSGQRWTKNGAANMLCLRTIKINKQWNKVVSLIKNSYHLKSAA